MLLIGAGVKFQIVRGPGLFFPVMRETLKKAGFAAARDSVVLLLGESGSGKDHLAKYIHEHSRRAPGPFFSINCAAVAPELAESELFGHERGAFTGAQPRNADFWNWQKVGHCC